MNHLKLYKMYESSETKQMTFKTYFDKMSIEDRLKMDALLDKEPKRWSEADKDFMRRMSLKNVTLYVGEDGKRYTSKNLIEMGYDPTKLAKPESKNKGLKPDVADLIKSLKDSLRISRDLTKKYEEEYDFTKLVNPLIDDLDKTIYHLNKFI